MTEPDPAADLGHLLDVVRANALQLHAEFGRPPRVLRVRAGDVVIEAEWSGAPEPTGGATEATPPVGVGGPVVPVDAELVVVRAPAVGTFYRAPEPGTTPFVTVGDSVTVGTQVALIEVMQVMVPVHTDLGGVITQVLVGDGESVDYDQPLFAIDTRRGR